MLVRTPRVAQGARSILYHGPSPRPFVVFRDGSHVAAQRVRLGVGARAGVLGRRCRPFGFQSPSGRSACFGCSGGGVDHESRAARKPVVGVAVMTMLVMVEQD